MTVDEKLANGSMIGSLGPCELRLVLLALCVLKRDVAAKDPPNDS